jgi:beta-1,3-N-acetylglucosaminyltransferase 5
MTVADDTFIHMPNITEYHYGLKQTGVQDFWIGHIHLGAPPIGVKSIRYYVC